MTEALELVGVALEAAQLLDTVGERRRRRAAQTLEEVLDRTGLSHDELLRILEADAGIEDLFVRGIQAAHDAADETKRCALTAALVRGVLVDLQSGTAVDVHRFLMATLVQLDAVHLAVLHLLGGDPPWVVEGDEPREWIRLMAREILNAMPGIHPVFSQVIATLDREGLIESGTDDLHKEVVFWIRSYGLRLLDFIADFDPH